MSYYDPLRLKAVTALANLPDVTLIHLTDSACNAVENFCSRKFELASYDELYPGTFGPSLFLHQLPVTQVTAVRSGLMPAIQIQNNTANAQAATVQTTADSVILTRIHNGETISSTLPFADFSTLGAIADKINTLGNGWYASISSQFTGWSSSDLSVYQRTDSARQTTANLSVHWQYLSGYGLNPKAGELTSRGWYGSGQWAFRVQYEAGFATVPEEIVQATIELAAAAYKATKSDANLVSESLGGYSYTRAATKSLADLSVQSFASLRHYRKPRVPYFTVR